MNGALIVIANPVADPDPNVTQPDGDRIVLLPQPMAITNVVWIAALGGIPDVELWFAPLGDSPLTWVRLNIAGTSTFPITPAGDALLLPFPGAMPSGVPLFLRVVNVNGATRVLAGVTKG